MGASVSGNEEALGEPEPGPEPPPGSPGQLDPSLAKVRRRLLEHSDSHIAVVKGFMSATENFYSLDMFLVGVANRSIYLVRGFVDALDKWNVFAAAPLVRLQVDSVCYMTRAPSATIVADQVLSGMSFRNLKDADGQRLTDKHLVDIALPHHPWLGNVYSSGNDWVHLSRLQILAPWEYKEGEPIGRISVRFPMRRSSIPPQFLTNMTAAMSEATDDLLTYMDLWRRRKGLPLGEARD
jgi:hypothetical protein